MKKRLLTLILVTLVLISNSATSKGYGFFDSKNETKNETITTGIWDFIIALIGPNFTTDLETFIDNEISQNPDSSLKYIYSQTDVPDKEIAKISSIDVFGYTWHFISNGKTKLFPTMGYPVLVDRELDDLGNPVHDIAPIYSTTPLYSGYNYFTAYDVMNLHTNNQYSLRLNYQATMKTSTSVGKVSNISFYAMAGLSDPDDVENMRNGKFEVYLSSNGGQWIRIASERSVPADSENEYFTFYSFDTPGNMLGEELYVKIIFIGRTFKSGFSRLVIDELVINTID